MLEKLQNGEPLLLSPDDLAKLKATSKEQIAAGKNPSEIWEKCGFGDYSTFFRAYKKQFGVSPNAKETEGGASIPAQPID